MSVTAEVRRQTARHILDKAAAGEAMLVVKRQQIGNIQLLRAMAGAVAAGGAGQGSLTHHAVGDVQQCAALCLRQRLVRFKGGKIVLQLFHAGHAGENHGHAGNGL